MILSNFVWSKHLSIFVQTVDVENLDQKAKIFDKVEANQLQCRQPEQFFYWIEWMRPFDQAYSKSLLIEEEIINS